MIFKKNRPTKHHKSDAIIAVALAIVATVIAATIACGGSEEVVE